MAEKNTKSGDKPQKGYQLYYGYSSHSSQESDPETLSEEDFFKDSKEESTKKEESSKHVSSSLEEFERMSPEDLFKEDPNKIEKSSMPVIDFHSKPTPPKVAVQEKIILCLDNLFDEAGGFAFVDDHPDVTNSSIRNDVITKFLILKNEMAKDTEFMLVALEPGKVDVIQPLTIDIHKIIEGLSHFNTPSKVKATDYYDITPAFRSIWQCIDLPEECSASNVPPSCALRFILWYGNSFLEPKVDTTDPSYIKFMSSPSCILDVFYIHEESSSANKVEMVLKKFEEMILPESYLFENSRNITMMYNNMAKLLAHPFQRVSQEMWSL